jgi:hypothetical protein
MLRIREEQMAVFRAGALSRNLPALVQEFERTRSQQFRAMGPERSEAFIHTAVNQGVTWGIRRYQDLWALIDLMLEFGVDFASAPERPWANGILNSDTLSGTAKVKLVTAHLRGQLD